MYAVQSRPVNPQILLITSFRGTRVVYWELAYQIHRGIYIAYCSKEILDLGETRLFLQFLALMHLITRPSSFEDAALSVSTVV
jgi:hypothetical protein